MPTRSRILNKVSRLRIGLLILAAGLLFPPKPLVGQQRASTDFEPDVRSPAFPSGEGPLVLGDHATLVLHWDPFEEETDRVPRIRADGMLQGAALSYGVGRVAVFGEAAMFTAQVEDDGPFGMNHPEAPQNAQFVLNVMHWLTGVLPGK